MTAAQKAINRYLTATGWTRAEFARRVGLDGSSVGRILNETDEDNARSVGIEAALRIEAGTTAARDETKVAPLRARDLLAPDLAALLPRSSAA